jgi:hypothetical protein
MPIPCPGQRGRQTTAQQMTRIFSVEEAEEKENLVKVFNIWRANK